MHSGKSCLRILKIFGSILVAMCTGALKLRMNMNNLNLKTETYLPVAHLRMFWDNEVMFHKNNTEQQCFVWWHDMSFDDYANKMEFAMNVVLRIADFVKG